ncbi:acetyl esterase [Amycolatopsis bartoniae]|uniref:Putative lipase LipH n=1 Tax=Amycolatopsis bartoniae TaxID=941986 RepID=A0A8H9M7Q0_9PSEU|nr:alpha/beta hydrolase [Amycolatopsis bartoniae]MBB2940268.1 acetyl esterase [Amycolatopsis bartoniae]TVT10154.1 alpha/beta hydrolase [Amycolatopsis bartoniae]GHF35279.1 putative lipase LipH [Amycolatopsis bartoniae]
MSLDPAFAEFLGFLKSVGAPGTFDGEPTEMRDRLSQTIERNWDPAAFAPVASATRELVGAHRTPVQIYRPEADGPAPTVLYFHPGGFIVGSAHLTQDVARRLSHDLGAVVVSVDYRLAPEEAFPAAVNDATAVLEWTQQHIADLGGDASRIGLVGESSGANLAVVAALSAARRGAPVAAMLLGSPVTDFTREFPSAVENAEGYFLEAGDLTIIRKLYFGGDTSVAKDDRISPALAPDLRLLPATVIGVAGFDPLRDDGIAFAGRLLQEGVPATLRVYPELIHPWLGMPGVSPAAERAVVEITSLLKEALSRAASPRR